MRFSCALLTGAGAPPGLTAIRSLREANLGLRLIAADAAPYAAGLFEDGLEASLILPSAARDPDRYAEAVEAVCKRHGVDLIIPGSEAECAVLAPLADKFRAQGVEIPVPEPEVLRFGLDKAALLARARERSLPAPRTLAISGEADLDGWDGGFPCVLKPRRSRGARGVSYPDTLQALKRDWRRTSAEEGDCLVQTFIPGGVDQIHTVGAIFIHGRLMLATVHRKLAANPPSGGAATAGETVRDGTIRQAGLAVLEATGPWHGFAAVELKVSAADGRPWLLEINPRLWGFSQMMTLAGVNAPALLVRALSGEFGDGPIPEEIGAYRPVRVVRSWVDHVIAEGFEPEVCTS